MSERCPRCESKRLKTWNELTEEEKQVVQLKPSDYPKEQRKKHRFCVRCGFEETKGEMQV